MYFHPNYCEDCKTFQELDEWFINYYNHDIEEDVLDYFDLLLRDFNINFRYEHSNYQYEKSVKENILQTLKTYYCQFDRDYKYITNQLQDIEKKIKKLEKDFKINSKCNSDRYRDNYRENLYALLEKTNVKVIQYNNLLGEELYQKDPCPELENISTEMGKLINSLEKLEVQINSLQKVLCAAEYYKQCVLLSYNLKENWLYI